MMCIRRTAPTEGSIIAEVYIASLSSFSLLSPFFEHYWPISVCGTRIKDGKEGDGAASLTICP